MMTTTQFILHLLAVALASFAFGLALGVEGTKANKTSGMAPLLSTANIACLDAPIKGFTKPE